jgi:dihydrofolate synthase/folylpolyglutamate synthase
MKLQKILSNFQKLHPKEIDLSLDRIKNLCEKKLGNPQDKIKVISVCGTNGKGSTIESLYAILKEANFKCNVFKSPHIQKLNERYIFNNN